MRLRNLMMVWVATALLAVAAFIPAPCSAQRSNFYPVQARPAPQNNHPPGHAGDWLRRYRNMSPRDQERALQSDPAFRRLPTDRQQMLRQRLQHFSSLPPQQQQRVLNRMETWEHLTPGQKQQARQLFDRMQQLPADRRNMVRTAVRDLSALPPGQREQLIDSNRFKSTFSPEERDIMRGATRLPLASPEDHPQ